MVAVDALGQEGFPSAPVWHNREWKPFYSSLHRRLTPVMPGATRKVFARQSRAETAEAIRAAGLTAVQLNVNRTGLEALLPELPTGLCRHVRQAFLERDLEISAASGTFKAIHPDREYRLENR